MDGKPDHEIFPYTRQVAKEGFPQETNSGCLPSFLRLPVFLVHRALIKKGVMRDPRNLESSAINTVLIDGLDGRVGAKAALRPPHGLVINNNTEANNEFKTGEYHPAVLLPTTPPDRQQDADIFNKAYGNTFRLFQQAVTDTYTEALQACIIDSARRAKTDPVMDSILQRNFQIHEDPFFTYQALRDNIKAAVREITTFLRVIPLTAEKHHTPAPESIPLWQWYGILARNSRPFVVEYALTDTILMSFVDIKWLGILDFNESLSEDAVSCFQIIGQGMQASLDFSEEFKAEVHRFEKKMAIGIGFLSGINQALFKIFPNYSPILRRKWYGCPAARVVTPGKKSEVTLMWERLVPIASSIYEFYFR